MTREPRPLTPNAHPCGIHPASQMEVWVDGVGSMDAGLTYLEAPPDGGLAGRVSKLPAAFGRAETVLLPHLLPDLGSLD